MARRKETLISVYGTDGKPIQPQGDILPSRVAETNSKANIEVDSASSHSENFTEVSNATKNCLSLQQPQADFMQAFIQTFMETFSKLYSSTTSNPKIQKETPVKQQDSDITKIDEYPYNWQRWSYFAVGGLQNAGRYLRCKSHKIPD